MKLALATGLGFVFCAASLLAQEALVGKYSGTFNLQTRGVGVRPMAISLEITNAADGKLQGKASRSAMGKAGTTCAGEYKLEGTYQDSRVEMTSELGGLAKDCILHFILVSEGKQLKGKMNESDIEFSK